MFIEKAIDISTTLEFKQGEKNIVFTSYTRSLFQDIVKRLNDGSEAVGEVLASYLQGNAALVSDFSWQPHQDYYDRLLLFGSHAHNITVMALIWPENTFSPIHYHQSWCVFGVYSGALEEALYVPDVQDAAKLTLQASKYYPKNAWACDGLDKKYYHKLGNSQVQPAISFHIYGVSPDNLHKINCGVGA